MGGKKESRVGQKPTGMGRVRWKGAVDAKPRAPLIEIPSSQ